MATQAQALPAGYTEEPIQNQPVSAPPVQQTQTQASGLPAGWSEEPIDAQQAPQTPPGEQVNDIGKTVIVPKEGESFSDTMARAAAQGKKTTQQDINDEIATAPKKAAEVLAAAPAIGFGGAATLASIGPALEYARTAETAIKAMAKAHPLAATVIKGIIGAEGYKHKDWLLNLLP